MADEITVDASITCSNGTFSFPTVGGEFQIDQATAGGGVPGQIALSTSESTIDTSELTSEGWCWIKNLDGTNNVEYGPDSGGSLVSFGLLLPGEQAVFRLKPSVTFKAKASASTATIQIYVFDA